MADIIPFTIKNATWEQIYREREDIVKRMRIVCGFFHCCFIFCLFVWLVFLLLAFLDANRAIKRLRKISQKRLPLMIITVVQDMQLTCDHPYIK